MDVDCEPEPQVYTPISNAVSVQRRDQVANQTLLEWGIIKDKCTTDVNQVMCEQVPFKFTFHCDDCNNKGSPTLLDKCCTKCVEWIESLPNNSNIPPHVRPHAWCSGCNVTHVTSAIPGMPPFPWPAHAKYVNYTEAKADEGILDYIEDNVCSLLTPACGEEEEKEATPAPGFMPTAKPIDVKICMPWDGGICQGRRLNSGFIADVIERGLSDGFTPEEGFDNINDEGSCEGAEYMEETYADSGKPQDSGRASGPQDTVEQEPEIDMPEQNGGAEQNPSPTPEQSPAVGQNPDASPLPEDHAVDANTAVSLSLMATWLVAVYSIFF